MDAKLLIEINRRELTNAEDRGLTSVQTGTLHSIFDSMEKQLDAGTAQLNPISVEKFRSDLAGSLAYEGHQHNWSLEGFKQVIALGQSALKSIMLINGGASIALLAFLGNLVSSPDPTVGLLPFANSMRLFVLGVFFSAVAYVLTYFSQLCYNGDEKWQQRSGVALHILTAFIGTVALGTFLWGSHVAYLGFVAFSS